MAKTETKKQKRVKHVFSNKKMVAHLWAHQSQDYARTPAFRAGINGMTGNYSGGGCSFSFSGEDLFSYETIIGKIVTNAKGKKAVLLAEATYSVTTSEQQRIAKGATSHMLQIFVPYVWYGYFYGMGNKPTFKGHIDPFPTWEAQARDIRAKLDKARKPSTYIYELRAIRDKAKKYATFFGRKIPPELLSLVTVDMRSMRDRLQKEKELNRKEKERYEAKRAAEAARWEADRPRREAEAKAYQERRDEEERQRKLSMPERAAKWKAGERVVNTWDFEKTLLRFNAAKGQVETSKGYEIAQDVALRFYRNILSQGKALIGTKFMEFNIDGLNGSLRIGCHDIPISEVHEMGRLLESLPQQEGAQQ